MITIEELKKKQSVRSRLIGIDLGTKRIGIAICDENQKIAIITPDKDIVDNAKPLSPAYIVFDNYDLILKWNRSLRFALAVCKLKDEFKNEL